LSGEEWATASCLKLLLNHLHSEALVEKEGESGDTALQSDIQHRIRGYTKRKYEGNGSVKNISCCLDPRFMLKNYSDEEAFVTSQSIVQQGVIIVRQMEEQRPPGDEKGIESSQSTDASCSAAPAKKRRLVNMLSTTITNPPQETMSDEECVMGELSRYLGYNQPEIKSNLNGGSGIVRSFLIFLCWLRSTSVYVQPVAPWKEYLARVEILLQPNTTA